MNAQLDALPRKPRLGFLGTGWIGCQRMQVLADSGIAEVAAVADAHAGALDRARACAPQARVARDLQGLLAGGDLDGIVIATPSGAHAGQAIAALEAGLAVFCQKPLTRTAAEARQVLAAARRADRLLDVDFSYRHVAGMERLREAVRSGELGRLYSVDLVFHNAYGPDKDWFYDIAQSGGGCVMDLGIHLVDLALWIAGPAEPGTLDARLHAGGERLGTPVDRVEDYATVQWQTADGASVRMACSWRLPAGCDAVIGAAFHGTGGGAALRNINGSFYDFQVERYDGTATTVLASPPDAWGGRALVDWAARLAADGRYDPSADHLLEVAQVVDSVYGR